jgi:hypothetical protein
MLKSAIVLVLTGKFKEAITVLDIQEQYLTDAAGNKVAVVISMETYQKIMDDLDELYCLKGYEQALVETELEVADGDYITLANYLNFNSDKLI